MAARASAGTWLGPGRKNLICSMGGKTSELGTGRIHWMPHCGKRSLAPASRRQAQARSERGGLADLFTALHTPYSARKSATRGAHAPSGFPKTGAAECGDELHGGEMPRRGAGRLHLPAVA